MWSASARQLVTAATVGNQHCHLESQLPAESFRDVVPRPNAEMQFGSRNREDMVRGGAFNVVASDVQSAFILKFDRRDTLVSDLLIIASSEDHTGFAVSNSRSGTASVHIDVPANISSCSLYDHNLILLVSFHTRRREPTSFTDNSAAKTSSQREL